MKNNNKPLEQQFNQNETDIFQLRYKFNFPSTNHINTKHYMISETKMTFKKMENADIEIVKQKATKLINSIM